MSKKIIAPIDLTKTDRAHQVVRGLIGSSPVLSGTILELFNELIAPPIEKRREEWMLEVTSIVNKLESKYHIDLDTLKSDENFISLLLRASGVAIKTHQKERVNALRNLLLNSVVDRDTTEDQKHLFLSLVDEQTISHFKILSLSQGGICWMPINGQDDKRGFGVWVELAKVLCREFDEFSEKEDFIYQIITDLQNKQLLRSVRIPIEYRTAKFGEEVAVSTDWGKEESLIPSYFFCRKDGMRYLTIPTDLGREFLRFILNDEM